MDANVGFELSFHKSGFIKIERMIFGLKGNRSW